MTHLLGEGLEFAVLGFGQSCNLHMPFEQRPHVDVTDLRCRGIRPLQYQFAKSEVVDAKS